MTLGKSELATRLGVSVRTVTNWVQGGCPRVDEAGETRFVEADVRRWLASEGRTGRPGRPSQAAPEAGTSVTSPTPRDDSPAVPGFRSDAPRVSTDQLTRARLATQITRAKKTEHELQQEKGLKDLGLAAQIEAAGSKQELFELSRQVTSHVAAGEILPSRGQVIRQLLAETRRALTAAEPETEAEEGFLLVTEQTQRLAEAFDLLTNGWRRRWLEEALALHLAEDRRELADLAPGDAGYDLTERLAALALDNHGEPLAGRASPLLPPVVPRAAVSQAAIPSATPIVSDPVKQEGAA